MIKDLEIFHDALELDGENVAFFQALSDYYSKPIPVKRIIWIDELDQVEVIMRDGSYLTFQITQMFDDFLLLDQIDPGLDIKEVE